MKTNIFAGKDWIDAEIDYPLEEYLTILDVAFELKRRFLLGEDHSHILKNKTIFLIFFNQSLRTRNSFECGITQLGGHANVLDPVKIYTPALPGEEVPYATERVCDVARTLERYGHGLCIRMYGEPTKWVYGRANETMKEFARWMNIPMINMECDKYHPCQALADMMTIKEKFGTFKGLKLVMSWAYSGSIEKPRAVPQSVILAGTKLGMDVVLAHPKGFELDPEVITKCNEFAKQSGGSFKVVYDMDEAFKDADVLYPKSWGAVSCFTIRDSKTGAVAQKHDHKLAKELFEKNKNWITTTERMKLAKPHAIYMHCLPCDRGMEVTDEVIDGPQSVVFDEAENRLHAQKAVLALLLGGRL